MNDKPTHRHKKTGDIVFWGDHLNTKEYELLPSDYWEKTHGEARRLGEEKGIREAKFKDWTIQEVAAHFESKIYALEKLMKEK